jgi:DNA-binding XRE family transcriptional regulator
MQHPCYFLCELMRENEVLFGEDAQALRKRAGMTQTQLAERWGLSRQQIGRYEKAGQAVPAKEADAYRGLPGLCGGT